jgi:hypothetical protein
MYDYKLGLPEADNVVFVFVVHLGRGGHPPGPRLTEEPKLVFLHLRGNTDKMGKEGGRGVSDAIAATAATGTN